MVTQNALFEKMGYPLITQEEHEDITETFSALADPESLAGSVMADAPAISPENELKNVFYVNFNPATDTQLRAQLEAVKDNVDLNNQFMNVKANTAVKEKIDTKALVDSELPRANYRAKVMNYLASTAPWTAGFAVQTLDKKFSVEKDKFHGTLISTFTEGLNLPASINTKLEGILTNIKNAINVSTDPAKTKENLLFFILITIYQKDDVLQAWQPYIRTIYFRVNQSLSTYTRGKKDHSSGINVDVDIEYAQSDGAFNDKLFSSNAKAGIQTLISGKTTDFIEKSADVPV